ncbi:MAG: hypothetical protein EPO24_03595 [Bacteroidetes bacterium]|nr:MAG: hypothetical protein EPO24_03595 [Bacteroidota bacterium]
MGSNLILTVGSLIVLGLFTLSSNTMISQNTQAMLQSEHYITAIALAQSVIDEAKTKSFDEKTTSKAVTKPESLSTAAQLGTDDALESNRIEYLDLATNNRYPTSTPVTSLSQLKFDDVDDYQAYTRIVRTPSSGMDTIRTYIKYVSVTYPDSYKAIPTFCKRLKVVVSGQYLPRPMTLEYAFIY